MRLSPQQIEALRSRTRDIVAAAANGMTLPQQLELMCGADHGVEELAGNLPAPTEHDREVMGPLFFRERALALNGSALRHRARPEVPLSPSSNYLLSGPRRKFLAPSGVDLPPKLPSANQGNRHLHSSFSLGT